MTKFENAKRKLAIICPVSFNLAVDLVNELFNGYSLEVRGNHDRFGFFLGDKMIAQYRESSGKVALTAAAEYILSASESY